MHLVTVLLITISAFLAVVLKKESFEKAQNAAQDEAATISQLGGRPAPQNRWPFVCLVRRESGAQCTGFLFNESHVLTVGHITRTKSGSMARLTVQFGLNRKGSKGSEVRKVVGVLTGFRREDSDKKKGLDWAILKLDKPSTKPPVRVNGWNALVPVRPNDLVWNVGFGLKKSNTPSDVLQENVFRVDSVSSYFLVSKGNKPEPGFPTPLRKPCGGDSGSPVMVMVNGEPIVVALHNSSTGSEGRECEVSETSSANARLTRDFMSILRMYVAKRCSYTGRISRDMRTWTCPSSHRWDAGVWDQGSLTPMGMKGKQCAQSKECAEAMNNTYQTRGAGARPVRMVS